MPGGCEFNSKMEIICPRHVQFLNSSNLHTTHCADCQQKQSKNGLFLTLNEFLTLFFLRAVYSMSNVFTLYTC